MLLASIPPYHSLVRCLTCQYDLRGLTERRCPECGRNFDPGDDRTFDSEALQAPSSRPDWILVFTAFAMVCIVVLDEAFLLLPADHWYSTGEFVTAVCGVAILAWRIRVRTQRTKP